ncbi:uncharacterized protein LOC114642598 isoform X2 [Erpetoichthys calabaricus]|uniref:uncharacterized protein LOC114642598 isoform X2 n=1 Tax=Erpetoichthys calabaricus TaxID=27687 RepID=UPI0022345F5D|nr:uncharacterized protein LOC114642598 isoform X2 [Erpetoichthys calabaricus]
MRSATGTPASIFVAHNDVIQHPITRFSTNHPEVQSIEYGNKIHMCFGRLKQFHDRQEKNVTSTLAKLFVYSRAIELHVPRKFNSRYQSCVFFFSEAMMHISICDASTQPALEECNTCCKELFHCRLCPNFNPTVRAKIEMHIDLHVKNALHFKDKIICRCRLPCRAEGHYHCPFCNRTVIRRLDMKRHLVLCQVSAVPSPPHTVLSSVPSPPHAALSSASSLPPTAPHPVPRPFIFKLQQDKILCRCRLPCRTEGHYHCPFCNKTIIRRLDMERHLVLCQVSVLRRPTRTTPSSELSPPTAAPRPLSRPLPCTSVVEHSYALPSVPAGTDVNGMSMTCPHYRR